MKFIGISGKAQHGKDFLADRFMTMADAQYYAQFIKFPLALPLKARVFAEMDGEYSYGEVFHDKPPEVRRKLQIVGTEEGRNVFGQNLWTLQVEAFCTYFAEEGMPDLDGVVIPDVRFPDEVDFVHRLGGIAVWIDSDRPTLTGEAAQHASEISLDGLDKDEAFEYRIINDMDTTVRDLNSQIIPILDQLFT